MHIRTEGSGLPSGSLHPALCPSWCSESTAQATHPGPPWPPVASSPHQPLAPWMQRCGREKDKALTAHRPTSCVRRLPCEARSLPSANHLEETHGVGGCTVCRHFTGCHHHAHSLGSGTPQECGTKGCGQAEWDAHRCTPAPVPFVCLGDETPCPPPGSESSDPLQAGCPRFNCMFTHPLRRFRKGG